MNVIIPARAGSRRIPGKNIKLFHGKPIIAYSIQLMRTYPGARIIVSTDSTEIARVAAGYGAEIFYRDRDLAEDHIGTQQVARNVLENIDRPHPMTMVLYATCPLLKAGDIAHGLSVFETSDRHYVHACDRYGADTGSFYYGRSSSFLQGIPLEGQSVTVEVGDIDINTPEDWERAERLYEEKYG